MRHRVHKVKLNRDGAHRKGLLNNLVRSLFLEESITTTITKAKWARSHSEHLISIAKKGTLDSFRRLIAETGSKEVAKKIEETTKELSTRTSGFLKLTKVGIRAGDKSVMVKIEFVRDAKPEEIKEKKKVVKKEKVTGEEEVTVKETTEGVKIDVLEEPEVKETSKE